MQELLNTFGIQPVLLVAQIVNFFIILYLLKRFALTPILKVLEDRRLKIAESIKNAEDAKKALEKAEEKEKEVLKKAQAQAQETLADARKAAAEISEKAEGKAKEQVEKILADAQKKIEQQTQEAEKKLAGHVASLATTMLEKSLTGMLDEKDQEKVLSKAVKVLKK